MLISILIYDDYFLQLNENLTLSHKDATRDTRCFLKMQTNKI